MSALSPPSTGSPVSAGYTPPADAAAAAAAAQWLLCARAGNREAFASLCELHRKRIWNVVASVTRKSADTDDLAQDTLLRAWAALPGYRGEAEAFGAWLCRIALNAAHDYQKSAWRRRVLLGSFGGGSGEAGETSDVSYGLVPLGEAAPPGPHEEALQRETARRVRAAVMALAPKQRIPIWLVYFEQFSLSEVARMENVPESTIRSRVKCGLRRLEKTLHDLNAPFAEEAEKPASHALPYAAPAPSPPPADWKGCVRA